MPQKRLLAAISAGLFLAFVLFSFFVAKERFTQLDFDTTVRLQDHLSRRVDLPFSILSVIGSVEVTGVIWLGVLIFLIAKKFLQAALALLLLPLALFFELFGKLFVLHPGPPHLLYRGVINLDFPSSFVPVDYSYPSGHVTRTAFMVVFLIGFCYFRKVGNTILFSLILIFFLTAMIVSRIYLGEHWSTDVIGGLLIGSSFGLAAALAIPGRIKNLSGPSTEPHPSR